MAKRTKEELDKALEPLENLAAEEQKKAEELRYPPIEITEADTRKIIAQRFVMAYFGLMGLLIIGVPIYNLVAFHISGDQKILQIPLADILQTYSAIVGPALGFVIAYYFKNKHES